MLMNFDKLASRHTTLTVSRMKFWLVWVCLLLCFRNTLTVTIASPGVKRVYVSYTCIFTWKVKGDVTSYSIYNQTTGTGATLNPSSSYTISYDKITEEITFTLNNVQYRDAGNYSLLVTSGTTTVFDATALLFVYNSLLISGTITVGFAPVTEGESVELTCNVTTSSLPVAYRQPIYYYWHTSAFGRLENVSNGPAMNSYGDVIPGYSIKDNGSTFRIDSVQYSNDQQVCCYGYEGSYVTSNYYSFSSLLLLLLQSLNYRPYLYGFSPSSKKFNAVYGNRVDLSLYFQANPTVLTISNWSFVNTAGVSHDLPPYSNALYSSSYQRLIFNFTSTEYYGNYSISLTNAVGYTTATFQVLPQGPPESPGNLRVYYVSHWIIYLMWNMMWANSPSQTVYVRLKIKINDSEVETRKYSYSGDNYNTSYSTVFQTSIQSDTEYVVSFWSTNALGQSGILSLPVRTRKQPELIVSSDTISIDGSRATINFTTVGESVKKAYAICCSGLTGNCVNNTIEGKDSLTQIVIKNIPNADWYYIDLTVYGGIYKKIYYFSRMVKGIKVSRFGTTDDVKRPNPLLIAVIVLAVIVGLALPALIAILIIYLCWKCRGNDHQ